MSMVVVATAGGESGVELGLQMFNRILYRIRTQIKTIKDSTKDCCNPSLTHEGRLLRHKLQAIKRK